MGIFNTKKLGFGLMRLPLLDPNEAASIDLEQTKQMVDAFLDRGFTYFDTAWMYCGFRSENAVKEVLVDRHPRDSFTLATKLHAGYLKSKDDRDRIFDEQRAKTGVEFFDYYLLHDMSLPNYKVCEELDCFAWLAEKKAQGLVRHMGFSFHDTADVLDRILTEHPEMEFVQLQINYLDWESEGIQSRRCYEVARRHNKPIIVMEPVKGGTLVNMPSPVVELFKSHAPDFSVPSWAIRFAASLEGVELVLSGMSDLGQLHDNMSYMEDFVPLNGEERAIVEQAAGLLADHVAIPCTGCSYCTSGCPKRIPIPKFFSLYNIDKLEDESKGWTPQGEYYERLALRFGKAGDCIGCGRCEAACPQHLPIVEHLKAVAAHFETE